MIRSFTNTKKSLTYKMLLVANGLFIEVCYKFCVFLLVSNNIFAISELICNI